MKDCLLNQSDPILEIMEKIIDGKRRKRKRSVRETLRALFYVLRTGAQWRSLPADFGPWQTVYYYFRKWRDEGVFEQLSALLVGEARERLGRRREPSLGIIDSRSVRTSHHVDTDRGIDGNKKVKGRKQHVVTDSLGLVIGAAVHPANVHDSKGAMLVLDGLRGASRRLTRIIADGGYRGNLADSVMERLGARLEVTKQPKLPGRDFVPAGRRWVVERTFAWMENFRRLTIDYEFRSDSTVAMIYLANCYIALNKVLKHTP